MNVQSILDSIKELVKEGNVARIVVKKGKKEVLSFHLTVGVAGAAIGLLWARLPLVAAVLVTLGSGCVVEVVKADGEVVNVVDEDSGKKVRDFAAQTVEKVKENIPVSIKVDIKEEEAKAADADAEFAEVVAKEEPKEEVKEEPKEEPKAAPKKAPRKTTTKKAPKDEPKA
jgi:outer membrane biosynthesis protein TonB